MAPSSPASPAGVSGNIRPPSRSRVSWIDATCCQPTSGIQALRREADRDHAGRAIRVLFVSRRVDGVGQIEFARGALPRKTPQAPQCQLDLARAEFHRIGQVATPRA
jgi:hypothetical protein